MATADPNTSGQQRQIDRSTMRRAVAAASAGNVVEFYDNIVFGLLAATIGNVFFPSQAPGASLFAAFAAFAVTFVARPVGGVLFGNIGDRFGRQRSLVIIILLMSGATCAIGALPGYHTIGVVAPIILVLLRILQGLSFGGELAGATSFVAEYARTDRRASAVAWVMVAAAIGNLLAITVITALSAGLGEADMQAWGWRIPFLVAGPLGGLGLYIRLRLDDTPDFRELRNEGKVTHAPLRRTLTTHPKRVAIAFGLSLAMLLMVYLMDTYNTNYLTESVGLSQSGALTATLVAAVVVMVATAAGGWATDRFGRKRMLGTACVGTIVLSYPVYLVLSSGSVGGAITGQSVLGVLRGIFMAVLAIALIELFPTAVRFTGFALGYGVAAAAFGGTAPFVATFLVRLTGSNFAPAFYLMAAAALTLVATFMVKERAHIPLRDIP